MPTLYIKQLKQHTPKGNSWKWGRKLYGQVRKLSPIYSLNLLLIGIATFLLRICPADDKTVVLHIDRVGSEKMTTGIHTFS
jgi:hypothetical protein